MKELDFDELDRAVNTLMGNVPKAAEPAKQDDVKTLTITPTLTGDAAPQMPVLEATPEIPATPMSRAASVTAVEPREVVRSVAPAARRSGRFMDVIHPSASTPRKAGPSLGVSRQGVTLEPIASSQDKVEESAPSVAEAVPVRHDDEEFDDVAAVRDWPDPLDMADEATSDAPSPEQALDTAIAAASEQVEPLSSPFIADAKVEKRPLGSPAPELMPDPVDTSAIQQDEVHEPQGQMPVPADAIALPEELQGDLMAIESDTTADTTAPQATETAAPETATDVEPAAGDKETSSVSQAVEESPVAPVVAAPVAASVGAVSIPQQYREAPSSGDQTTGAIYDTDTYHQPLEYPAKKRTGWLWVVWVLILLLLGAGGGALAYLYLLQ